MSPDDEGRAPSEIIEAERAAYIEHLPELESNWPWDVRMVYEELLHRLFDWEEVIEAQAVVEDCGIGGHDIYSRFGYVTGYGNKGFVVYHRTQLAKRLLRYDSLSVSSIAFAVGYDSPSGFSKTFKRRVGVSPIAYRRREED